MKIFSCLLAGGGSEVVPLEVEMRVSVCFTVARDLKTMFLFFLAIPTAHS
jgi:hypothetical protein